MIILILYSFKSRQQNELDLIDTKLKLLEIYKYN